MKRIEAHPYPVIPFPKLHGKKEEVMSMSDYVHARSRPRHLAASKTIESRLMFGFLYVLYLARAMAMRLMPWRKYNAFSTSRDRESIFTEARNGAGTIVTSSFMGM